MDSAARRERGRERHNKDLYPEREKMASDPWSILLMLGGNIQPNVVFVFFIIIKYTLYFYYLRLLKK